MSDAMPLLAAAPAAAVAGAVMARLIWPRPHLSDTPGPQRAAVVLVEEGPEECSVLLDRPAPPPAGWTAGVGGAVWLRRTQPHPDAPVPTGAADATIAPTLCRVPLVIGRADGGLVTMDMATIGLLNLDGHPPALKEFLRAVQEQAAKAHPRLVVVNGDDGQLMAVLRREGASVVTVGRDAVPGEWHLEFDAHGEAVLQPLGLAVRVRAGVRSPVLIRVLGPVGVEGTTEPAGAKVTELIAFVGLHPSTTDERIKSALWPDRIPSAGTFHNTVSAARRVLGTGPDGPCFPPSEGSRYELSEAVSVDWVCLEEAAAAKDLDAVRRALATVAGVPFEAKAGYHWAHEEGLCHAASADVARAARVLMAAATAGGDEEAAVWAARQGLRSCPGDPVLLEALGRDIRPHMDRSERDR